MIAGWPRRGHRLLELYCGDGRFLESFWQSGFDVTGQERDPGLLSKARARLKQTADFTCGHPEHLPFEDRAFDYVVCLNGLHCSPRPRETLNEMCRLAARGLLLAFPNAWSIYGLSRFFLRPKSGSGFKHLLHPFKIQSWLRAGGREGRIRWASNLLGPACTWHGRNGWMRINFISIPLPLGACALLRLDFSPPPAGSGILLNIPRALGPKPTVNGLGRSGRHLSQTAPPK